MFLKITTINSDNGLPNEQVHAIAQDSFGRLWLASPTGLSRYNGSRIKIFDQTNGLDCIGLRTVRVSADGIVWIGTDRGLEAISINGDKKNWSGFPDWNYGIVESLHISGNIIWAGTSFGLLKLQDDADTNELELLQKNDVGLVKCILQKDEDHLLVLSARYGLLEFNETGWRHFNTDDLPQADAIICIAIADSNDILVGTTSGLYLLDKSGKLKKHFALPGNNKVTAISVSGNDWWIGMSHTLILANCKNNEINVTETINVNSSINELFIDPDENIWIATNNHGLKRITCIRTALQKVACGKDAAAFSIKAQTDSKYLQVGGDGFISTINRTEQVTGCNDFFILPGIVWDTCTDPVDATIIWIATDDGLFFSKNNAAPEKFTHKDNLTGSPNRVLLPKGDAIWLGTIGGLFKIENGEAEEIKAFDNSRFGYVYTLSLDNNNRLWVGTLGKGLWIETEKGFTPVINEFLSEFGNTYNIATNNYGETVVIQEDRLLLADDQMNFRLLIKENPVAGWSSVWINKTTIATGSNNGILLIDTGAGKIIQHFNLHLGKSAWQFTSTRSLYYDGDDKLYCGINAGLFTVSLKKISKYAASPKVFFEEVEWQNILPEKKGNQYKLKAGKWSVNIAVFTNWLIDEDLIRFRFKLVGFDETWSELSAIPIIRYNSLPAGYYDLQCQVYTPLSGFSETAELLQIHVFTGFWKPGFIPGWGLLQSAGEVFFKSRQRNKLLRKRNVELEQEISERRQVENALLNSREELRQLSFRLEKIREEERLRMSREVHDELGQSLTGIKMGISWLKKKIMPAEINVAEKFDETLDLVDETTRAVRRISTELRPGVLDSFGIIAALEWQSNEFEKRSGVKIAFNTNCPDLKLNPDKSIVLFRIFQETLTNISRYAEASVIIASVEMQNENVVMKIKDNGKGFIIGEVENKKTLGIIGMKERALMIGAVFYINSTPGRGTTTEIKLALSKV